MRNQHPMYMQQHAGTRTMNVVGGNYSTGSQRPPNVQVVPESMPMGSQQEWRQLLMQQQQSMSFNSSGGNMRPNFNQGSEFTKYFEKNNHNFKKNCFLRC